MFNHIGIIGRQGSPHIDDSIDAVYALLSSKNCDISIDLDTARLLHRPKLPGIEKSELRNCDLIVVVGGDGSILGVARDFAQYQIPVVGVNRGSLGFLADISPDEIGDQLSRVLDGDCRIEEHFLIQQSVRRENEIVHESVALNDVIVSSGSLSKMMDFQLFINDEFVYDQRSEGVLVSSPTGSTAYSLSAGGPIMHPQLDAIAVIPMYPHTLTSRPIVVPGAYKIQVKLPDDISEVRVSSDSQIEFNLLAKDTVEISKYEHSLRLIHLPSQSFYEACRRKLDWGSRLGLHRD